MVGWLRKSRLSPTKTKVLWRGASSGLGRRLLALDRMPLTPAPSAKSMGMILDVSLIMEAQDMQITRLAFFKLLPSSQEAPILLSPDLTMGIHAMFTSRLYYCNSLCADLPLKFQLVQNAMVRVLLGTSQTAHMEPVPCQLHCLPAEYHFIFGL